MVHSPTTILGVDPGITGAIALISGNHQLIAVHSMPTSITRSGKREVDAIALADLIRSLDPSRAVVEAVHAMPRQGVVSTFSFGRSAGVIHGVLAALRIPVVLVTPRAWKRRAALPTGASKAASRQLATATWPDHAHAFAKARDDGRAEAALIARHG